MGKGKSPIILILILAISLRLINLTQSFWLDEASQVILSGKSLWFQWFGRGSDFHPPLFYILVHYWLKLGQSEFFLRLLPVAFGIANVYLIYLLAKKLFNKQIAILASFFLAISPYHIYYSQEMRVYSMLAFLGTLSMFFLWQKKWFFYALVAAIGLYTHYSMFFLTISQFLWVIFYQRKSLKKLLVSFFAIFLLYLPWLPQLRLQLASGGNLISILPAWGQMASLSTIKALPLTVIKFSIGRITFDNKILYAAISLVILLWLVFIFRGVFKKLNQEKIFAVNWFFTPLVLAILISVFLPQYQPFRFLYTIVPFYLLLTVGIFSFNKNWRFFLVGVFLLTSFYGLFTYRTNPRFAREDWRGATAFIESQDPKETVAIFEFSDTFAAYQWYSKNKVSAIGVLPGLVAKQEVIEKTLPKAVENKNKVFLFQYLQPLTDPQKLVESWLNSHGYHQTKIYDFSGVGFVYNYYKQSL